MKEISVGIDLGTTNSTISTCWPEGHPRLIRDEDGSGIIPSVISFTEKGEIIIGQKAKQRMLTDMENTFYSIKRFIGRDMRKDDIQWALQQHPFKIESGPNGIPMAVTHDKKIPAYQLSGYMLKHLKEMAENSTGQQVQKAVITVPANFNESQRKATKQAGEYAGFEVMRIFNEPTAAALAYGLGKTEKEIVAIFDFGGGTFDITILRLEDPVFEVLSTSGDMMLGGDDIDRLILQDMLAQFQEQYGFAPSTDSTLIQRFLFGAERMKCQLSDWIVTAFEDRHIRSGSGKTLKPFHYELNRDKFKKIAIKLAERSLGVCSEALRGAGVKVGDINKVVLVGGTTRIPFLRKMVEEFFAQPPLDKIQPDVVVSIGASIQAFSLAGGEMVFPAEHKDMLPTLSTKRLLPQVKGVEEFDFQEGAEGGDEAREGEAGAAEEAPATSLSRPFEEEVREPADQVKQEITAPIPLGVSPAQKKGVVAIPRAADEAADDLEISGHTLDGMPDYQATKIQPQAQPLPLPKPRAQIQPKKQTLKGLASEAPTPQKQTFKGLAPEAPTPLPRPTADLPMRKPEPPILKPKAPFEAVPAAAGAGAILPDNIDDLESLDDDIEEIPDIQVLSAQKEVLLPKKRPSPLEALESAGPQTVTPESLAEPYIPKDVLKHMQQVRQQEAQTAAAGAIASAGVSVTAHRKSPEEQPRGAHAPLLLDVTPSTLGVATVGGFREIILKKNSPVPVEKSHIFTTSADQQEKVVVRILEGESKVADQNNELGVIELLDIRAAPRGEVKIEVTFDISVDGILEISAKNLETGRGQKAKLTLFGT